MTAIAAVTEDFTGGTVGSAIALTPTTILDSETGAGADSTVQVLDTVRCMRSAPGGTDFRLYRADFPATVAPWFGFYFSIDVVPTGNVAIDVIYSGTTKVADLQVTAGTSAIRLRSVNTTRWESAPVALGVRHYLEYQVAPNAGGTGTIRVRLYEGSLRDAVTPTQDSGSQAAAALAAAVDNIRFGSLIADSTLQWRIQRLRGDDAGPPERAAVLNTAPTAYAEPVGIVALFEDFKGGASGNPIALSPATIFDSETGAGAASTFSTDTGHAAMRNAPGATDFRLYRSDLTTAMTDVWRGLDFTLDAVPTTTVAILAFYSGTTKIGDLQVVAGASTIRLRSVSTTRWTSTALEVGVKHRLWVRVAPVVAGTGVLRLRIHEGDARYSAVATQDSGDQVASATVGSVDNFRVGSLGADATLVWRASRMRAATAPPAALEPYDPFTLVGSGTDPDPGSSIVAHNWTQLSGPATPLTPPGTGTGPRTGVVPAAMHGAELVYGLTVTDDDGAVSAQDTTQVTALPHDHWARVGGVWCPVRVRVRTGPYVPGGYGEGPYGAGPYGQ